MSPSAESCIVQVREAAEFSSAVAPRYETLLQATPRRPTTLEVVIAPGVYRNLVLTLTDRFERGHVALLLRAADPARPPRLEDVAISLSGPRVALEGLHFARSVASGPILAIDAPIVDLRRCAWIENMLGAWPPDGSMIAFSPGTGQGGTLAFRECWLIGNGARGPGALLTTMANPPARVVALTFERVAFLDNRLATTLLLGATDVVTLRGCLIYQPMPTTTFAIMRYLRTDVVLEQCLAHSEDLDHLLRYDSSPPRPRAAFRPATLHESTVFLRRLPVTNPPDGQTRLEQTRLLEARGIPGQAPAGALAFWADAVAQGRPLDIRAVAAALHMA